MGLLHRVQEAPAESEEAHKLIECKWDNMSVELRDRIRWDAIWWYDYEEYVMFGCGCRKMKDGRAMLCDYHSSLTTVQGGQP